MYALCFAELVEVIMTFSGSILITTKFRLLTYVAGLLWCVKAIHNKVKTNNVIGHYCDVWIAAIA